MSEATQLELEEAKERLLVLPRIGTDPSGGGKPENPFALSVGEQLGRLRAANREAGFGLDDSEFVRLELHAPPWPTGKDLFRIIRFRTGIGSEGVKLTFDANMRRIQQVFGGDHVHVWEHIRSDLLHLRLLIGSPLHVPCAMWDIIDLNVESRGRGINHVRGQHSLADEMFHFVWMFPEFVRTIDHERTPGLLAGGYELHVPSHDSTKWRHVPRIGFDRVKGNVTIDAVHIDNPLHAHGEMRHVMPKLSG
jgi:hypothetical protein